MADNGLCVSTEYYIVDACDVLSEFIVIYIHVRGKCDDCCSRLHCLCCLRLFVCLYTTLRSIVLLLVVMNLKKISTFYDVYAYAVTSVNIKYYITFSQLSSCNRNCTCNNLPVPMSTRTHAHMYNTLHLSGQLRCTRLHLVDPPTL